MIKGRTNKAFQEKANIVVNIEHLKRSKDVI